MAVDNTASRWDRQSNTALWFRMHNVGLFGTVIVRWTLQIDVERKLAPQKPYALPTEQMRRASNYAEDFPRFAESERAKPIKPRSDFVPPNDGPEKLESSYHSAFNNEKQVRGFPVVWLSFIMRFLKLFCAYGLLHGLCFFEGAMSPGNISHCSKRVPTTCWDWKRYFTLVFPSLISVVRCFKPYVSIRCSKLYAKSCSDGPPGLLSALLLASREETTFQPLWDGFR